MREGLSDTPLYTPRLVLEPLLADHAEATYEQLRTIELHSFIPQDPPPDLPTVRARYRRLAARRSPDGQQLWLNWIARQRHDGTPVGTVEATVYPNRTAALAYMIFVPFQRRGYAREAVERVIERLIRDYGVDVVTAEIDTRNAASIAVIERIGFERVATHRAADFFKGAISDEYRYEYRPMTAPPRPS